MWSVRAATNAGAALTVSFCIGAELFCGGSQCGIIDVDHGFYIRDDHRRTYARRRRGNWRICANISPATELWVECPNDGETPFLHYGLEATACPAVLPEGRQCGCRSVPNP